MIESIDIRNLGPWPSATGTTWRRSTCCRLPQHRQDLLPQSPLLHFYLIAQQQGLAIPIAMAGKDAWQTANLRDGMPTNPIIDDSVRLYEQEVDLAL